MSLSKETIGIVKQLNRIAADLKLLFCRRDPVIDLMRLALLCQEHVLLLGPPGSGKSELVSRFAESIKARQFQYLLTRFTEPTEIFGSLDLEAFHESRYRVVTTGMLPEAQVAFLDEVFQSSSAILNSLLTVVHERLFFNGSDNVRVPLITLFGASNSLPDDPTLRAFSDRFLLRIEVEPVPDDALGDLFDKGWLLEEARILKDEHARARQAPLDPERLTRAYRALPKIDAGPVQPIYQDLIRRLRAEGAELSERRLIKGLKMIRGAAMLDGVDIADNRHLWPLNHMWTRPEEARIVREAVQPLVEEAGGPTLYQHRSLDDIIDQLDLLEARAPDSEGALIAHLSELAQLRREIKINHIDEQDLLRRVNAVTQRHMETLTAREGA